MQHLAPFPSMRHSTGRRAEAGPLLSEFPLEEQTLVALAHQPWASAGDLAQTLGTSESDVGKTCHQLESDKKLIAGRRLGVTRRIQRRYVLTRDGVGHVTKSFQHRGLVRGALPLTWQMTEGGATKMLERVPMIECFYEILPTFWTSGLARPFQWQSPFPDPSSSSLVWLGVPTLMEVLWFPSGRLHAAATWRFERDSEDHMSYPIPFFWAGLLPQEDYRSRSLRLGSAFIRCHQDPKNYISWDIAPPTVAIGTDEFAAFRSNSTAGYDVQVGSTDTAGTLVWSAEASHGVWTLREQPPQARTIGHPEIAARGEGPDLAELGGVRQYRIMAFVGEFRGATKPNLVEAFHMSRGAVTAALEGLAERGLITSVGKHFYVTPRGLDMLAARDRVDATRLVEVTYSDPEGKDATKERRHDAAVAEVAAKFRMDGMPVAAGWRWNVSWKNGQLAPDLWVQVPLLDGKNGVWTPVEVEFSARTERRIGKEKLRSYRLAPAQLGRSFPILVITGEEKAAKLFDKVAPELFILTTTLTEFLTCVWEGPDSVWRRRGHRVGLSESAQGFPAHLQQQTGRSLDYSKPTPGVWARLLEQEIIWSDPWAEGLDREFPPIHPQLEAEMNRLLNEGKAGPSVNKLGSSLLPAAPYPAPLGEVGTAQDRMPNEASVSPTSLREPARKSTIVQKQTRSRWDVLSDIHLLIAEADRTARQRLNRTDLTDSERLYLQLFRAIVTYGLRQHVGSDEHRLGQIVQRCLNMEDQHKDLARSKNGLAWLIAPSAQVTARMVFRQLLKEVLKGSPDIRRDATKIFGQWAKMVDSAVRTARKARRTLG